MRSVFALLALLLIPFGGVSNAAASKDACPRNAAVVSARFDGTGASVQLIWSDGLAQVYNSKTGVLLSKSILDDHGGTLLSVSWSADGKFVLAGGQDGKVHEWEAATGNVVWSLPAASNDMPVVAWSPDGTTFLTATEGIELWDVKTRTLKATVQNDALVVSLAWSPDSKQFLVGGTDDSARIYAADSGTLLTTLPGHSAGVWSAAWSPDGKTVVTSSQDGTVYFWDANMGILLKRFVAHKGMIRSIAWSPNGQLLMTGGDDQLARLWESGTANLFVTLRGHTNVIWDVEWSPNGKTVVTGGLDGVARLWDATTGQFLRTLCAPA